MPNNQDVTFKDILDVLPILSVIAGVFGLIWRWIDKYFESQSESRKQMLRELIEEMNKPRDEVIKHQFRELTDSINGLNEAIREMRK